MRSRRSCVPPVLLLLLLLLAVLSPVALAQEAAPTDAAPTDAAPTLSALPSTDDRRFEMREVRPEVAAWMTLRGGLLRGSTGCSRLLGSYGRIGQALRFKLKARQAAGCSRGASLAGHAMTRSLAQAARFEIVGPAGGTGAALVIRDADGVEDLRFEIDDASPLAAGEWRLVSYTVAGTTAAADPAQPALLTFSADSSGEVRRSSSGDVIGSSGCNGLVGRFARRADVLSFRRLEHTDAPCPAQLVAQEAAVLAILDAPSLRLDLPLDRLVIVAEGGGDSLEFVTSSPVEGTTWLLGGVAGLPDARSAPSTVTLRLDGDLLSGEGPCGPYTGRSVASGVFLSLSDLRGQDVVGCTGKLLQRELLAALRETVLLERDEASLRLLDARGIVLATFTPAGLP